MFVPSRPQRLRAPGDNPQIHSHPWGRHSVDATRAFSGLSTVHTTYYNHSLR